MKPGHKMEGNSEALALQLRHAEGGRPNVPAAQPSQDVLLGVRVSPPSQRSGTHAAAAVAPAGRLNKAARDGW